MGQLASGITGLGLLVFPAGPGKVKIGTGFLSIQTAPSLPNNRQLKK
jgi:hypothetical protein